MLISTGVAVASAAVYFGYRDATAMKGSVFVAKHQRYDGPLVQTIRDGMLATGLLPELMRGKRVC